MEDQKLTSGERGAGVISDSEQVSSRGATLEHGREDEDFVFGRCERMENGEVYVCLMYI